MSNIYIQEPPTSGKVVMKTTAGDIDIELWTKEAPKACRNFIQLCMEGYYDNTIFHRVVKGFIIQGGDPTGTGEGGESVYGEAFKDEFHTRLRFCRRGLVAMANAGKNDNGSQFFFTLAATPELQNKHTIYGKIAGDTIYNVVKLEDALVDERDRPVYPQKILKTIVLTNPFDDIIPRTVSKKKSGEEKKKKKEKKGVKDFKLLSFGEEAEEDEEVSVELSKKLSGKSKSAHDNLADPKLSSQPVTDQESPPQKKKKRNSESDSELEGDDKISEENVKADKEREEITERVRNKLKGLKKNSESVKEKLAKNQDQNEEVEEEEYYFGKDKEDERKKKTEEIKKQIRDLKRGMRDEKNKKLEDKKKEVEEEKKKETRSEITKNYLEIQEKYKKEKAKVPLKGVSRDEFTQKLLAKFKNKLHATREKYSSEESTQLHTDQDDDNDDPSDLSWMAGTLKCKDKGPVLAKDASTKEDDWFEIYDPRNPINKRRRGETGEKSSDARRHRK